MVALLLIGFVMVGFAVWLTYQEYMNFYYSVQEEIAKGGMFMIFRCFKHIPKLFPCVMDIFFTIFLGTYLGFGAGVVGGVTGVFASNVLSCIVYYHSHIKKKIPPSFRRKKIIKEA